MNINVDFLILGLTGPLGAGCTTLGRMIERVKPSILIKRKKLYESVLEQMQELSRKMESINDDIELKQLHKRLMNCYKERACLEVLRRVNDPAFVYISMSALIVKLAVDCVSTPEFEAWEQENTELGGLLRGFKSKWNEVIIKYDSNEKTYHCLGNEDLEKIDEMFMELNKLRTTIVGKELELFFNHSIDEFHLQTFGDNLRLTGNAFSNSSSQPISQENLSIVAREVNRLIKYYRNRNDNKQASCFVVDAFRNPSEVEFFRRYDQFFLISIYASELTRRQRTERILSGKNYDRENFVSLFRSIDERDWGANNKLKDLHKQNVARCYYLADIAINNDDDSTDFDFRLFKNFLKYFALIASPGCIQPTKEETYMNLAYSLSLRSTCISRKVGAVITDKAGYVLGLGWNDVAFGQVGCGLRQKRDFKATFDSLFSIDVLKKAIVDQDLAAFDDHESFCFKDVLSEKKIKDKLDALELKQDVKDKILKTLKVKRLEYCRALHAEENALLQVAARGGMGVRGGEIYTTTFPCELCAKKIYQSGIRRIYYTEPYPNSISEDVFLNDGIRNIETRQFEGVKSLSYFKLYKSNYDKKEAQELEDV